MLGAAETDGATDIYFPTRVDTLAVAGTWTRIDDEDWQARWRADLRPVVAGPWTVTPTWLARGTVDELVIDPGQAFGTGHHETTRRCLEALGALDLSGRAVLDVGTGSGVLAIAAARAGARVVAVDTDPVAVEVARANAERNGVVVDCRLGSVEHVAGQRFDVVVANLDTATLVRLADALLAAVASGGTLVAGGISNQRADEVTSALGAAGASVSASAGSEWTLVTTVGGDARHA
jgi:ribosomal protein L11 methyltransferase